jgi:hypothetical protein
MRIEQTRRPRGKIGDQKVCGHIGAFNALLCVPARQKLWSSVARLKVPQISKILFQRGFFLKNQLSISGIYFCSEFFRNSSGVESTLERLWSRFEPTL